MALSRGALYGIIIVVVILVIAAAYFLTLPPAPTPTTPTATPTATTPTVTTPTATTPVVEYKRTLVIGTDLDNQALDVQQAIWTTLANWYAFSPLVAFDQNRNVVTDLAESYEIQEGGKVLIVKLPKDLKFPITNNPLNARTVNESVYRYRRLSPYSTDWIELNHTEIIDDYTIKFVFNNPPGPLWAVITSDYGAPVDVEYAKKVGDSEFNAHPIGAGPFVIKEWVKGSQTILVPNPNYKTNLPFVENKGPNPYLDQVIIRVITDDLTRVNEFLAGNIDILAAVPPQYVNKLKADPNTILYEFAYGGYHFMIFNLEKPQFKDKNVRKAIYLALNRDDFATVNDYTTEPQYSFISPGMLCYNSTIEEYARKNLGYNLEEAKRLLDEAGWKMTPDGVRKKGDVVLSFVLDVPNDNPRLRKIAPIIQEQLSKIGIKVELREYEQHYIREKVWRKDFEAALNVFAWVDPDGDMAYWLHSRRAANSTYVNPEVDKLFDAGMRTFDLKERTKIYSKLQMILLEDLPVIPLQYPKQYVAVHKNVEGVKFVLHTSPLIYLNDVKVRKS
jgi:peptide/nickel transport system substrate-binding protein